MIQYQDHLLWCLTGNTLCDMKVDMNHHVWWLQLQYIPRNMHTVFALLCFVVVIHWLIFPYPSGLLHWHCGNLTFAPVPAKQPWWIWINTSCEFIMNDCITTTKQTTTKPCAYFLGYTVRDANFICNRIIVCCLLAFYRYNGYRRSVLLTSHRCIYILCVLQPWKVLLFRISVLDTFTEASPIRLLL